MSNSSLELPFSHSRCPISINSCHFFGCTTEPPSVDDVYCSNDHNQMANQGSASSQAALVKHGFPDNIENIPIVLALLQHQELDGQVKTGIPLIPHGVMFETAPWTWSCLDPVLEEGEAASPRTWVFFTNSEHPPLKVFDEGGCRFGWKMKRTYEQRYTVGDGSIRQVPLATLKLHEIRDGKYVPTSDHARMTGRRWHLSEHVYGKYSAICVSVDLVDTSIFSRVEVNHQGDFKQLVQIAKNVGSHGG